jgi:hypothetical protein
VNGVDLTASLSSGPKLETIHRVTPAANSPSEKAIVVKEELADGAVMLIVSLPS